MCLGRRRDVRGLKDGDSVDVYSQSRLAQALRVDCGQLGATGASLYSGGSHDANEVRLTRTMAALESARPGLHHQTTLQDSNLPAWRPSRSNLDPWDARRPVCYCRSSLVGGGEDLDLNLKPLQPNFPFRALPALVVASVPLLHPNRLDAFITLPLFDAAMQKRGPTISRSRVSSSRRKKACFSLPARTCPPDALRRSKTKPLARSTPQSNTDIQVPCWYEMVRRSD
jgi:hypothetical protein